MKYTTIQVTKEFRDRLKELCRKYGISYETLLRTCVDLFEDFEKHNLISEDGEIMAVILPKEYIHAISKISEETGLSKSEVVMHMIDTIRFIFEEKITLADIIAILRKVKNQHAS